MAGMPERTIVTGAGDIRVWFVGPMIGRNSGHVTTQGEIVADALRELRYDVTDVSRLTNRWARLVDVVFALLRHLREIDVAVIQVYSGRSFVVEDIASLICSRAGIPIVFAYHGGNLPVFVRKAPRWSRRVLARGAAHVVQTSYLAGALGPIVGAVTEIPNLVRVEDYPFREVRRPRPRLVWMRTFHPVYNPAMAVRALARVREVFPDATLTMAGQDKGLKRDMERLAQTLGVADAVRFPGFLGHDEKVREAEAADVFVNTSNTDNHPVAILEAQAFGLPVVTTAVGGIPHMVRHRETALLVDAGDDGAVADAIVELLENEALCARLSTTGRAEVERCGFGPVTMRWVALLESVARRRGGAPGVRSATWGGQSEAAGTGRVDRHVRPGDGS